MAGINFSDTQRAKFMQMMKKKSAINPDSNRGFFLKKKRDHKTHQVMAMVVFNENKKKSNISTQISMDCE